jgi:choline dehydrogenase
MDETDYIIVGAGSAGSVLADRLTADGRHQVTVLEAGGSDRRFYVASAAGLRQAVLRSGGELAVSDRARSGAERPAGPLAAGEDPGGIILDQRDGLDPGAPGGLRGLAGRDNPGWGWDDVLPAYRAIEDNEAGADDWRGQGGPLFISANRSGLHPLGEDPTSRPAGGRVCPKPRFQRCDAGGRRVYQMTIRGARRNSTARAFLRTGDEAAQPAGGDRALWRRGY